MVAGNQPRPGPEGRASRTVTSARRLADRLLGRRADPSDAESAPRPSTRVDRLLDSGIFDVEYYTALAGREFESERHAARHCINVGMPHGRSPHPLLDIYSVPRSVRTAWRRGQIGKVVDHLESETGWGASSGPLARYPALPLLRDRCAPGARFILDDAARPDEKAIINRWTREHGVTVMERTPGPLGCATVRAD